MGVRVCEAVRACGSAGVRVRAPVRVRACVYVCVNKNCVCVCVCVLGWVSLCVQPPWKGRLLETGPVPPPTMTVNKTCLPWINAAQQEQTFQRSSVWRVGSATPAKSWNFPRLKSRASVSLRNDGSFSIPARFPRCLLHQNSSCEIVLKIRTGRDGKQTLQRASERERERGGRERQSVTEKELHECLFPSVHLCLCVCVCVCVCTCVCVCVCVRVSVAVLCTRVTCPVDFRQSKASQPNPNLPHAGGACPRLASWDPRFHEVSRDCTSPSARMPRPPFSLPNGKIMCAFPCPLFWRCLHQNEAQAASIF